MTFQHMTSPRHALATLLSTASAATLALTPLLAPMASAQDDDTSDVAQDRIRVTALKREQDETDVPVSLTTFDTDALNNTRARTIEGLEQLTPNFSFEGSGTFPNLTVRGVGAGGRNVGFSTRAGAYQDGVYVGQPPALPLPLLDVERVEILRGPQGNLYGRNTVSGAVNVVTKLPGSEPEFRAQLSGGSHNLVEAQGYVGGPIVPGVLFGGLSAGYEKHDGFVTNLSTGNDDTEDLDGVERLAFRGAISLDASEALSFTLRADYSNTDTTNIVGQSLDAPLSSLSIVEVATGALSPLFGGDTNATYTAIVNQLAAAGIPILVPVNGPGIPRPVLPEERDALGDFLPFTAQPERTVQFDQTPLNNTEVAGLSLSADYETEGGFILRSITAQRRSEQVRVNDLDYTTADLIYLNYMDEFDQFSQELQIISPDVSGVRFIAGAFYLDETADSQRLITVGEFADDLQFFLPELTEIAGVPISPFGLVATFGDVLGSTAGAKTPADAIVETQSSAIYGSVDVDVNDKLTVTAGGRYTVEEKELEFAIDGTNSGIFSIVTPGELTALGFTDGVITDDLTDEEFTWSASAVYSLSDSVNVFGRVATGFKSGGWNVDFVNVGQVANGLDFDTETVISYEAGIKGFAINDRVRFDFTGFFSQYDDFQINQFIELAPGVTVINLTNAAEVESAGFEMSADANLSPNLSVGANFGYVDTQFIDYIATVQLPGGASAVEEQDYTGNALPYAPEFSGAIFANYTLPISGLNGAFDLYGEYAFQDESFSDADNVAVLDARNLVNTRVTFRPNNQFWTVSVWGNNVFDDTYVDVDTIEFFNNQTQHLGPPATWGADISVQF